MTDDDRLLRRVRESLAHLPDVVEKRMFGGTAFMVSGKLCVTAGRGRMMCRIDPALHDDALKRAGCRTVVMRGRPYRGYVHVSVDSLTTKAALRHWIGLAVKYNAALVAKDRRA